MRALMITAGTLIFVAGFVAGGRLPPGPGAGIHARHGLRRDVLPEGPDDAVFRAGAAQGRRDRARMARYSCATK